PEFYHLWRGFQLMIRGFGHDLLQESEPRRTISEKLAANAPPEDVSGTDVGFPVRTVATRHGNIPVAIHHLARRPVPPFIGNAALVTVLLDDHRLAVLFPGVERHLIQFLALLLDDHVRHPGPGMIVPVEAVV